MTYVDARGAQAGQLQQLRRIDCSRADHDFPRRVGLAQIAPHGIPDTGATLPVEHQTLGQGTGLDMQIRTLPDRV